MIIIETLTIVESTIPIINDKVQENAYCSNFSEIDTTVLSNNNLNFDIKINDKNMNENIKNITEYVKGKKEEKEGDIIKKNNKEEINNSKVLSYPTDSNFIMKDEKLPLLNDKDDILNNLSLKKDLKQVSENIHSNSILSGIEEVSSIEDNDIQDIKDISLKIKDIENLVVGTSVKVNKIIEDFQDDSFIVNDTEAHRMNASFTVSNLSKIEKNKDDINIDQYERPYHSFIISTNDHSFISQLANTSMFIEKEKADDIHKEDIKTNHSSSILNGITEHDDVYEEIIDEKSFIDHYSFVLSKKNGKKNKHHDHNNNSKNNNNDNHTLKIKIPEKKDKPENVSSPKSNSTKKHCKSRKRTVYKNEIIKAPNTTEIHDSLFCNHLPIVGGDIDGKGSSIMILTPVKAKKKDREEFGVSSVVTPVRRSLRNIQKKMTGSSSHKKKQKLIDLKKVKIEDDKKEENTFLDTPVPIKYHSSTAEFLNHINLENEESIPTTTDSNNEENGKRKIYIKKEEDEKDSFLNSDYEDLFKPSNKFEAIEEILDKYDYAFIPNKAIIIDDFDFPDEITYTPKKEVQIKKEEE